MCVDLVEYHAQDLDTPAACICKASWARIGFWGTVTQEAMVKNFPANLTILHVHTLRTFAAITFLAVLADQLVELHIGETYLMTWSQVAWPRLRRFGLSEPTMWQKDLPSILAGMSQLEIFMISTIQYNSYILPSEIRPLDELDLGVRACRSDKGPTSVALCDYGPPKLEHLKTITISDRASMMLKVLTCISLIKRHAHHPRLLLYPEQTPDLFEHIPSLLQHLHGVWEWKKPVPSAVLSKHLEHSLNMYTFVLRSADNYCPIDEVSTLQLSIVHSQRDSIFHEHQTIVKILEVNCLFATKILVKELDKLVSERCPNIERIVFRTIDGVFLLREWVEHRRGTGRPFEDVVYEDCQDAVGDTSSCDNESEKDDSEEDDEENENHEDVEEDEIMEEDS
jgi:hypothetical protein